MGTLTTKITASCLETNSVTKKMLCKGGKQKICTMVTGSYNKVFYTHPCVGIILRPPPQPPGAIPSFVILKCWHEKQESAQSTPCRHLHGAQTDTTEEWILVLNKAFAESPAGSKAGDNSPEIFQFFQRFQVDSPWDVQQFMKLVPLPFEEDAGWGQTCPTAPEKNPSSVWSPGKSLEETPQGRQPNVPPLFFQQLHTGNKVTSTQQFECTKHCLHYQ